MKRFFIILLGFAVVLTGCAGMQIGKPDYAALEQAEKGEAKISAYSTATDPAADDVVIGNDVSDTRMGSAGTTKKFRLGDFPISAATQAALDQKMGQIAGFTPDGNGGLILSGKLHSGTYVRWGNYTVLNLPVLTSGDAGAVVWVIDGATPFDTTTGDGEYTLLARWNGSAWAAVEIGKIELAFEAIPIGWCVDGTSAPDALDTTTFPPYAYRTFDYSADEDVSFLWFTLPELDVDLATVEYRVTYLVTEDTGPSSEGVAFSLAGGWVGDGEAINPTLGTSVALVETGLSASQGTLLVTDWSAPVTLSGTSVPGHVAEFNFLRSTSHASDTYEQLVGVVKIELKLNIFPYVVDDGAGGGGAPE